MFTNSQKLLSKMTALSMLFLSSISLSAVIDFKDVGNANAYVFKDYVGVNSDSQGALLIGGNTQLSGYTVATLNDYNQLALATSGNLIMNGGDINGLASVNGSATVGATNALREANASFDFNQAHFQQLSSTLSSQSNTSNTTKWSNLLLDTKDSTQTFITNIAASDIANFSSVLTTSEALGARIVFNISGVNIDLNGNDWLIKTSDWVSHSANNVLFNFFEATTVNINTALYGSVLAPNANVFGNGGMINGQLIANSFTTGVNGSGTQLNDAVFNSDPSDIATGIVNANSPSVVLLFLLTVGAIFVGQRKLAY
ncbi:MAG: choice-of-anchor A family protein [Glaciecola sp.]